MPGAGRAGDSSFAIRIDDATLAPDAVRKRGAAAWRILISLHAIKGRLIAACGNHLIAAWKIQGIRSDEELLPRC